MTDLGKSMSGVIPELIINDTELVNREFMKAFQVKKHFTAAPTYVPKNFFDQIVFAHIGADYKLYIYVDNAWKSVTLT